MIRIVIASILKPIDEVRMYKRFGLSLAKTNKYDVNIIGINSKKPFTENSNITFHTLTQNGRGIKTRLKNLNETRKYLTLIRPEIFIATSPETLLIALLFSSTKHTKVIYDIQEDYFKNITLQRVYPTLVKYPLAVLIRSLEIILSKHTSFFFLAEEIYRQEISFIRKRKNHIILENKFSGPNHYNLKKNRLPQKIVFTGTISYYSGIHHVINTYKEIKKRIPDAELTIAGKCFDNRLIQDLKTLSDTDHNITLIGLTDFVSHDDLISEMINADIAIMGYEPDPVNQHKIPSKLFEYISLNLITVLCNHPKWIDLFNEFQLGIGINFDSISAIEIIEKYQKLLLVTNKKDSYKASWSGVEISLYKSIDSLINKS